MVVGVQTSGKILVNVRVRSFSPSHETPFVLLPRVTRNPSTPFSSRITTVAVAS